MSLADALAEQFALYDEDAFVMLASRGLLRRASKDLERSTPRVVAETEDSVTIEHESTTVVFDLLGIPGARCTCPAAGVCQHTLAAALFLRDREDVPKASPQETRASLHDALMAIEPDAIERWVGKPVFGTAVDLAARQGAENLAIATTNGITISFLRPMVSVRYFGGPIESIVVDRVGPETKKYAAGAILAYQRAFGRELPDRAPEIGKKSIAENAPLRREAIDLCERLFCELIETGLVHLTEAHARRLEWLAVLTSGAELARLSLALRRLAGHLHLAAARSAGNDVERLFDDLAQTNALVCAIAAPLKAGANVAPYLIGESRTHYQKTATLELWGLGSYPWRTGSGYLGLTTVFWSPDRARWLTWSESRPEFFAAMDPVRRYYDAGPWRGCSSPSLLDGSQIMLTGSQVNEFDRLSSSEETTAIVQPAQVRAEARFAPYDFADWQKLGEYAERLRQASIGLRQERPGERFVVLRPASVGTAVFDAVSQILEWPILDESGAKLSLPLAFSPLAEAAIRRLESPELAGSDIAGIVGILDRKGSVMPIALLHRSGERPLESLFFSGEPATATASRLQHATASEQRAVRPEAVLLNDLNDALLRHAERGLASGAGDHSPLPGELRPLLQRLERAGLDAFGAVTRGCDGSPAVLRLRYLTVLALAV